MHWLSYFIPLTVYKTTSPYNSDIRVLEESGKYKLLCNGARESGQYIAQLWRHAFAAFGLTSSRPVTKILVLGVAGGTVIHMLRELYPKAAIIGVDIDNVIIDIGKTYFGLSDLTGFRAVCQDADTYVASARSRQFDCVVVDLYIGSDVPEVVLSESFERNIRRLLTPRGFVLVNYLRQPGYENKVIALRELLSSLYKRVLSDDINNNRFFLAE